MIYEVFVFICSVGIGRIGIYCVIEYIFCRILGGDLVVVDIENIVC